MITQAQLKSIHLDLDRLIRKQKFFSPSVLDNILVGLSGFAQSEFFSYTFEEKDLPRYSSLMFSQRVVKNFMDLISVCDANNQEQVSLVFLIAGFYSTVIYMTIKIPGQSTYKGKDFELLGINRASDNRLKALYDLALMDPKVFAKIKLDDSQRAYLKSAVVKVNLIFK